MVASRFPLLSPAVTSSPGAGEVFPLKGSFICADRQIAKSSPANSLALSVTFGDRSPLLSPAVTSSPGAGEVFPQRESPWQSTQTSSLCQGLSLWERWHGVCRDGEGEDADRISMFCTNGAFSPCEKCEKSLSIKSVMHEDATKIYPNKESAPCSRRQKAVCFKQTGQRPAQSDNNM